MSNKNTKIILFGINGDLSKRKLLPALNNIISNNIVNNITQIIGVGRSSFVPEQLLNSVFANNENNLSKILECFSYKDPNTQTIEDFINLKEKVNLQDDEQLIIFLSLWPEVIPETIKKLGEAKLNGKNVKLMVEKPFGNSLASSEKLFEIIKKYFNDEQVYKIDHYLFKTLLQNINNFKNENEILSKIWNDTYIHSIYVEAYEEIDIQGRSEFYEQTGLLRDFIQSHLMETLILTIAKNDSIEERNKVIDSILPIKDLSLVKRSQYIGYKYEVNNPNSNVETFCEVVLKSNDNNWKKTKFVLASGKSLKEKTGRIIVKLKDGQKLIFNIIDSSFPKEITVDNVKHKLSLTNKNILPDAYEGVFTAAIKSINNAFAQKNEILKSWQLFQPLLDYWKNIKTIDLYLKNSKPIKSKYE